MKTKLIHFFLFSFLIISCQNSKEKFIEKLTNNSEKFWDLVPKDEDLKYSHCLKKYNCGFGIKFFLNGQLDHYVYKNGSRKIENSNGDDVYYILEWKYLTNSKIFMGDTFKVIKLTKDSLVLSYPLGETRKYVKSKYKSS